MNDAPGLNLVELRRQLSDLADSVEAELPWDDPLPHVLRAATAADLDSEPKPGPGSFTVLRGRVSRISWPRFNPVPLASVAAAFLAVALIGILVHGGGNESKKSTASTQGGFGAAAGGTGPESRVAAGTVAPNASPGPGTTAATPACGTPPASSRVALSAPAQAAQGSVIRVRVTTSAGVRLTSLTILVRAGSEVVGRLVSTVANSAPTASGSASSVVVTGRLVRTAVSCGDLPGPTAPGPAGSSALALPAGHYQLVVTGSTGAGRAASAPVAITVHH